MRWLRNGFAPERWGFVAVIAAVAMSSVLVGIGGIIVVINCPPPAAVWVLVGVGALCWFWRRGTSSPNDAADVDANTLAAAEHPEHWPDDDPAVSVR